MIHIGFLMRIQISWHVHPIAFEVHVLCYTMIYELTSNVFNFDIVWQYLVYSRISSPRKRIKLEKSNVSS
jgi:hypothetical protein